VVVQSSGGPGRIAGLPVAPPAAPPETGEPPEQAPDTDGWQMKPSPQSTSALQGSCHRYAHIETVCVVHVGSDWLCDASHFVLAAQGAVVVPPEQLVTSCESQSMPAPQSLSVAQGPGWQVETVTVPLSPPAPPFRQSASGGQAGDVTTPETWQVNPGEQSAFVAQVCARAGAAYPRQARAVTASNDFFSDMKTSRREVRVRSLGFSRTRANAQGTKGPRASHFRSLGRPPQSNF
jgi:hypothetical protein